MLNSSTTSHGVASGVRGRYPVSPMTRVQGTGVPFAGPISARLAAHAAHAAQPTDVVARKADDRVPPRGRTL